MSSRVNPKNVAELLLEDFVHYISTEKTDQERRIKDFLKGKLVRYLSDSNADDVDLEDLSVLDRNEANQAEDEDLDSTIPEEVEDKESDTEVSLEYKQKAVHFWKETTNRRNQRTNRNKRAKSFQSVQHRFRMLKSKEQLKRWAVSVKNGGVQKGKLHRLEKLVLAKFEDSDIAGKSIHDMTLRMWAMEAAAEVSLPNFKACASWATSFKQKYNIGSRKITTFLTKSQHEDEEDLKKTSMEFVEEVRVHMGRVGAENTLNSDQSGFNFELCYGRTLKKKGVKSVKIVAQSSNALTHSYTIQPTVNANGEFLKPMLLVYPEPKGCFGPRVSETMFKPPNLYVVATKSGKCTTGVLNEWYNNILLPQIHKDSVILLDAFGGFNEGVKQVENNADEETPSLKVLRIPKLTTGLCQPLDRFGFRPYKEFVRVFSETVKLKSLPVILHVRDNVIKLQSLAFNQMCSPRFREVFKYGWFSSGYIDQHPSPFVTPAKYCFQLQSNECEFLDCENNSFIRCAWCKSDLCFEHFYETYHLCEQFLED